MNTRSIQDIMLNQADPHRCSSATHSLTLTSQSILLIESLNYLEGTKPADNSYGPSDQDNYKNDFGSKWMDPLLSIF